MGTKTREYGLFVSLNHPYLKASPDEIVDNSAVVDIKCSDSGRNEIVKPGPHFKYLMFDDNGNIVLKSSRNYFDQIQGQLYISNIKDCSFVVVVVFTLVDIFVDYIMVVMFDIN